MVPADKKLYALRDVTDTVPSIPLIVASILSKKLAEGLEALVLDVKFGAAAFMRTKEQARELAQAMVALGNQCGVNTRAVLTNMDAPLGRAAGNWLEVREAVAWLTNDATPHPIPLPVGRGEGGRRPGEGCPEDLRELVLTCAAHLLVQTGKAKSLEAARKQAEESLASGAPRNKWDEMLVAQGADLGGFNRKLALDHTAAVVVELTSPSAGFVSRCDARIIGEVIRDLGGGRVTKESAIDHDVGVDRLLKPGERVQAKATLCRVHAKTNAEAKAALVRLRSGFKVSARRPATTPLVAQVVGLKRR
jgi:thymidine phosphorylase